MVIAMQSIEPRAVANDNDFCNVNNFSIFPFAVTFA